MSAQLKRAAPGAGELVGATGLGQWPTFPPGHSAARGRSFTPLTATNHMPAVSARNEARRRTTATARIREVWDSRLRQSERELVLEFIRVAPPDVAELSTRTWSLLDEQLRVRIFIGLRDLAQLGNEASYALGYSRRNG